MASSSLALMDVLAEIDDPRQASGKRYSLQAILALAVAALLCGYKSYSALADWGRNYGQQLAQALGFADGKTPCAATFYNVFRCLECSVLEQRLAAWALRVLAASGDPATSERFAIDGKTLRGSKQQGAPAAHLLSAVGHRLGLTIGQLAVPEASNEITMSLELVKQLVLAGKVISGDALLTQRDFCQYLVEQEANYVLPVKANQATLLGHIEGVMESLEFYQEPAATARSLDSGHGRIEERRLTSSSVLSDHQLWPGLQQVFKVERRVVEKKSGEERCTTVYGITSLSRQQASAADLLAVVRGHWTIENRSHWVRDVLYEEDRSQVRDGGVMQVMAALRNTAIGLLRAAGKTQIARSCREYAANPWRALTLLGIRSPS